MTLRLLKIFANASSSTDVFPNVQKFFFVTDEDVDKGGTLTINATDFFDDQGNGVSELPDLGENNSYLNVYINGILQMQNLFTYTAGATGSLVIDLPEGEGPIYKDTVIVLEVVNFAPNTTTNIET